MTLDITAARVRVAAARLHDGGWFFSPRQLYYAVCADVESPPARLSAGEVGLGVLLILVGAITGQRLLLAALGGIGLLLVAVGLFTRVRERRPPPPTRALAVSYAAFEGRILEGLRGLPGLVTPAPPGSPPSDGGTLVLCDRPDTAAVLAANAARLGEVRVDTRGSEPLDVRGLHFVVLHDCDPGGCGLVAELRERGAEVVDAGINPRELGARRLQLLEGAPARLPRDLSAHLDAAELDWLRSGRRLECATETPAQLVERVRSAAASRGAARAAPQKST